MLSLRVPSIVRVDSISAAAAVQGSEGEGSSESKEGDNGNNNNSIVQTLDKSEDFISFPEEIDTFRYVHSLARLPSKDIAGEARFLQREIGRLVSQLGDGSGASHLHDLVKERLQKVSEYAEKVKSSLTGDLFSQTLQADSLLPSSGFVVIELKRAQGDGVSAQTSLWLKIDAQTRTLSFHDRGRAACHCSSLT